MLGGKSFTLILLQGNLLQDVGTTSRLGGLGLTNPATSAKEQRAPELHHNLPTSLQRFVELSQEKVLADHKAAFRDSLSLVGHSKTPHLTAAVDNHSVL